MIHNNQYGYKDTKRLNKCNKRYVYRIAYILSRYHIHIALIGLSSVSVLSRFDEFNKVIRSLSSTDVQRTSRYTATLISSTVT
jgi:hypothetical protein